MATIKRPVLVKLFQRYNVSQDNPVFDLGQTLIPITNADELLRVSSAQSVSATSTTARTDTYTVPAGKLWYVQNICGFRNNAAQISIYKNILGTSHYIRRASATELIWTGQMTLKAGESIIVDLETGTSGPLGSSIIYDEMDLI